MIRSFILACFLLSSAYGVAATETTKVLKSTQFTVEIGKTGATNVSAQLALPNEPATVSKPFALVPYQRAGDTTTHYAFTPFLAGDDGLIFVGSREPGDQVGTVDDDGILTNDGPILIEILKTVSTPTWWEKTRYGRKVITTYDFVIRRKPTK